MAATEHVLEEASGRPSRGKPFDYTDQLFVQKKRKSVRTILPRFLCDPQLPSHDLRGSPTLPPPTPAQMDPSLPQTPSDSAVSKVAVVMEDEETEQENMGCQSVVAPGGAGGEGKKFKRKRQKKKAQDAKQVKAAASTAVAAPQTPKARTPVSEAAPKTPVATMAVLTPLEVGTGVRSRRSSILTQLSQVRGASIA
jgi:hypothetical protein